MAKKPKATEGAETLPSTTDDMLLKIVFDYEGRGVHDGLGGVWKVGQLARLPNDVANVFIDRKLAVPADGASVIEAKKAAVEAVAKIEAAAAKAGAQSRQRSYDDAPKSIRDLVKEFGDEVISRWEMGEDEADILKDYGL